MWSLEWALLQEIGRFGIYSLRTRIWILLIRPLSNHGSFSISTNFSWKPFLGLEQTSQKSAPSMVKGACPPISQRTWYGVSLSPVKQDWFMPDTLTLGGILGSNTLGSVCIWCSWGPKSQCRDRHLPLDVECQFYLHPELILNYNDKPSKIPV